MLRKRAFSLSSQTAIAPSFSFQTAIALPLSSQNPDRASLIPKQRSRLPSHPTKPDRAFLLILLNPIAPSLQTAIAPSHLIPKQQFLFPPFLRGVRGDLTDRAFPSHPKTAILIPPFFKGG